MGQRAGCCGMEAQQDQRNASGNAPNLHRGSITIWGGTTIPNRDISTRHLGAGALSRPLLAIIRKACLPGMGSAPELAARAFDNESARRDVPQADAGFDVRVKTPVSHIDKARAAEPIMRILRTRWMIC